ncbi:class I SAM-dependent methyltransferase [Flavihumibacter petaseus]|uniref:O-methyltransferase C-terminal domain-containing protein n=1 Tax=Flavihumibacter petaseus NBRC 106054 TaxID=1220578 RepID=A0A0E9MYC9_9BACT|nr:class I SAM-dependent methyltransferase [Flavihumibacter petaseus]GAO42508.1 hypothetical protein FPE01S_01_15230 [Flavihumibacter petaseus NBRC 106054]
MEAKRRPFQGVLNILSFNRHFYVYGLLSLGLLMLAIRLLPLTPPVMTTATWILLAAYTYGLVMPLLVSAYVYDFSGYYHFDWLQKEVEEPNAVGRIVNINAGFDETSFILQRHFPKAEVTVFDFYNAKQHTEPAIVRARKVTQEFPDTARIATNAIPLGEEAADLVFLLSAAHEIRSNEEKARLLEECRRICKPGGKVIMVEHLRDFPNFLAFTIGFTHFFSRDTWKKAFTDAGFADMKETKFTPFMSVFNCTA